MGEKFKKMLWLSVFFLTGCVTLPRSYHALEYKDQKVYIDKHHYYRVGPLSKEWDKVSSKDPGIVFRNKSNRARLTTEAICGAEFEDLSLQALTKHLFIGLENVKKEKEEIWNLSGRQALYTQAQASVDGVPVLLELVVIKKNRCQFDFMGVIPAGVGETTTSDFTQFVKGFDYR